MRWTKCGGAPEKRGEAEERAAGAGPGERPAEEGLRGGGAAGGSGGGQDGEGVRDRCGEEAGRARPPRREEGAERLHSNRLPPGPGLRGSAAAPRRETAPGGAGGAGPGPWGRPPVTYLQPRAR